MESSLGWRAFRWLLPIIGFDFRQGEIFGAGKGASPMGRVNDDPPEGYVYVFTKYITLRDGTRIYASTYGKKAFRILVKK